jgi:hypothetical protein
VNVTFNRNYAFKQATEYSALLLFFREVLNLFLSLETGCAQIFLHFRQPPQRYVGMVPKSGVHDRFLPHYFQFIIRQSLFHSMYLVVLTALLLKPSINECIRKQAISIPTIANFFPQTNSELS